MNGAHLLSLETGMAGTHLSLITRFDGLPRSGDCRAFETVRVGRALPERVERPFVLYSQSLFAEFVDRGIILLFAQALI